MQYHRLVRCVRASNARAADYFVISDNTCGQTRYVQRGGTVRVEDGISSSEAAAAAAGRSMTAAAEGDEWRLTARPRSKHYLRQVTSADIGRTKQNAARRRRCLADMTRRFGRADK
jgi:hypothetical protein